jgi:predicted transcriptional regulator of viral defense system
MVQSQKSHRERVLDILTRRGMARLAELLDEGVTATSISRLEREGAIVRLSRGLYQLPDAPLDTHHMLAEAVKLVPRGVVCLVSALAFHDLTDKVPAKVWLAIGAKDWKPRIANPPIRFVRFPAQRLARGVKTHTIEDVPVRITDPAHTIVDLFRYRKSVGQNLAVEGLKEALRVRKVTPGAIARLAIEARVWTVMRPYLEALTIDG